MEEEVLGNSYDARIMRRLLAYMGAGGGRVPADFCNAWRGKEIELTEFLQRGFGAPADDYAIAKSRCRNALGGFKQRR